jgi:hypothetical protein
MPISNSVPLSRFVQRLDLSSREKRRKAVALASSLLDRVRAAELTNLDNFPPAFRDSDAFANAESSFDALLEAIVALDDIY